MSVLHYVSVKNSLRQNIGASLIELLISLIIISIILLGTDAMQLVSIQEAQANYYFAVGKQQINNMSERLSVLGDNNPSDTIYAWNKQNQEVLPLGKGTIKGIYPNTEITISWGNDNEENCKANKIGTKGCLRISK